MTANKIIEAILNGEADDDLDAVRAAIRDRESTKGRSNFYSLKAGDKVRLTNLRPLYLVGMTATVVRKNNTRVVVRLDDPPPGTRFHGEINAQPTMLEKIETPAARSRGNGARKSTATRTRKKVAR